MRKGGWSFNYCKLSDNSCFEILGGSIFRTDFVIWPKGGQNTFFKPKLGPKAPKLNKINIFPTAGCGELVDPSKWPQHLTCYGYSKKCIFLRLLKVLKNAVFCFLDPYNGIFSSFSVSCELLVIESWLTLKMIRWWISHGCSNICIPLWQLEVPEKWVFFISFLFSFLFLYLEVLVNPPPSWQFFINCVDISYFAWQVD